MGINRGAAQAGVGLSGATEQDDYVAWGKIFDNINQHGGFNGCKAVPVYGKIDSQGDWAADEEKACVYLTEDQHVVAAIMTYQQLPGLLPCMAKHKTPLIEGGPGPTMPTMWAWASEADMYSTYRGYVFSPDALAGNRWAGYIDMLRQYGYFGSAPYHNVKVGFIEVVDGDGSDRYYSMMEKYWRPALAKLGIPVAAVWKAPSTQTYSDIGSVAGSAQNAVLDFQQKGVTHVMFGADDAYAFYWFSAARSQDYHPRYFFSGLYGGNQANQLDPNATDLWGLTWGHVDGTVGPVPANPALSACTKLLTGAYPPPLPTNFCADAAFLQDAFALAPKVAPTALLAGVSRLDSTFRSAVTFSGNTLLGSQRFAAVTAVRPVRWNTSDGAFQYIGPIIDVR